VESDLGDTVSFHIGIGTLGKGSVNDEDAEIVKDLRELGEPAIRELERVLRSEPSYRDALLQQMIGRPELENLAQLIAMAQTDEVRDRRVGAGPRPREPLSNC
jgi:hypothetical protein